MVFSAFRVKFHEKRDGLPPKAQQKLNKFETNQQTQKQIINNPISVVQRDGSPHQGDHEESLKTLLAGGEPRCINNSKDVNEFIIPVYRGTLT